MSISMRLHENMVKEISGGIKKEGEIPHEALVAYLHKHADDLADRLLEIPQEKWKFAEIIVRVYREDPAELVKIEAVKEATGE